MTQLASTSTLHTAALDIVSQSGGIEALLNLRKQVDRDNVLRKVEAMLHIEHMLDDSAPRKTAIAQTAIRYSGQRGFSTAKLASDYRLWARGGQKPGSDGKPTGHTYAARSWKIFLPNYTNGDKSAALKNHEFTRYIRTLFAETSRADATGNALHERLLDNWFGGHAIPGYGTIQKWCAAQGRPVPTGHLARARAENFPGGWSANNLRRMLPSMPTRIYLQRGEHAAHSHWGDQLLRDRSKLMPFQMLTFDDVRFDLKVIQPMPGKAAQVVYPEAIFTLDVATGLILAKAVVGTYTRDADSDGGKKGTKRAFQHADMRWLMAKVIEQYGLPKDWKTRVLLENASASMSTADIHTFEQLTGIEFEKTGLIRQKLTQSGFVEQGGMPWQKGWIEALFRLVHTRINHLPGTVGARYDLTDGRMTQTERYTLNTIAEAHRKGIPLDELNLPLLTIDQFHGLLDEYVQRLNWRINHNLQGFARVHELEIEPGRYIRHDDPLAAQLMTVGTKLDSRIESPAERFSRLMTGHEMQPAHPRQLLPLSLDKKPVTVAAERVAYKPNGEDTIYFRDQKTAQALAKWNGQKKALIGFLATDRSAIHLFTNDDNLEYIGSPARVGRVDITDEHAILKRSGEVHRGRENVRQYAADLMADQDATHSDMRQHNADRLGSAIATAETSAAKAQSDRTRLNKISDEEADEYFVACPLADAPAPQDADPEESPF